jgi:hypothetical protein
MKRFVAPCVALSVLAVTLAFAHFCNNIYKTPDRIIVKPEKPITTIQTEDQLRVFVKNNYPTFLLNVALVAKPSDPNLKVAITPNKLDKLNPAEKGSFTVHLDGRAVQSGDYKVNFGITADNVGFEPMEQATNEEVRGWLKQGNVSSQVLTAETLAARKDPMGREVLKHFCDGQQGPQYQVRGIRCVGKAGQADNADLVLPLLDNRNGLVRGSALLTLGMLHGDPDKINSYAQTQDPFVYTCCAAALAMNGNTHPTVIDTLTKASQSGDGWVRIAGAWGLGCFRDQQEKAAKILDDAFDTLQDAEQRVFAGDALTYLAARTAGAAGE